MLITSVVAYFLVTIGIGLWAAQRVKNSRDFLIAGRSLPLYMNMATVFATWFGAETVLSVSATFAKDGLGGIVNGVGQAATSAVDAMGRKITEWRRSDAE